jgi:hypothetical protein
MRRNSEVHQLNLFHPQRTTPRWRDLPVEVRREVLKLLERMLGEYARRQQPVKGKEEMSDE